MAHSTGGDASIHFRTCVRCTEDILKLCYRVRVFDEEENELRNDRRLSRFLLKLQI
jgi:hypothetical protein